MNKKCIYFVEGSCKTTHTENASGHAPILMTTRFLFQSNYANPSSSNYEEIIVVSS